MGEDVRSSAQDRVGDPEEELEEVRAVAAGLQAQLSRVRRERDASKREAEEAREQLEAVYASRTWRVGRALLLPPYRVRQRLASSPRLRGLVQRVRARERRAVGVPAAVPRLRAASPLPLEERKAIRDRYAAALARERFSAGSGRILMAVSSTDLDAGRGDLYTGIGLGRQLEALGYEVLYRAPEGWYDLPEHTDLVIALIAERSAAFDPASLPRAVRTLAWVRNQTRRWAQLPTLGLFDAVASSSLATQRALRRAHPGPHLLLPIGVDTDLFSAGSGERRDVVVATVNSWSRERELHRVLAEADLGAPLALFGRVDGLPSALRPIAAGPVSYFALPSVYAASALVLDDLQDVNRAYGNVNSRIYEALACGALPIANATAGLADAGLEDVPVARTAAELAETVGQLRADPALRGGLAARLREVVLARHPYARRAQALDVFLREELPASPQARTTVGFAPDYRPTNPFQTLLGAGLAAQGARLVPTDSPMALVRSGAVEPERYVYHRHWTATLLGPATGRADAERRCAVYLDELDALRDLGGRIVWTVHNALPHECRYPDIERRLRQGLADRADLIHVLCAETADLVRHVVELPADRVRVLPHGSYIDVYPNVVTPLQARVELGLDADDVVLLSLGGIRPYRGIDALLDAFDVALRQEPRLRLVVAGRPGRHPDVPVLRRRCEEHPRVVVHFDAVPDEELQVYFNAADAAVFSHREVLNSGGVLLAWSFGRPVIAPALGCVASTLAAGGGVLYPPDQPGALAEALGHAASMATPSWRRAAFDRAREHTSLDMARGYAELIEGLLLPPPARAFHGGH